MNTPPNTPSQPDDQQGQKSQIYSASPAANGQAGQPAESAEQQNAAPKLTRPVLTEWLEEKCGISDPTKRGEILDVILGKEEDSIWIGSDRFDSMYKIMSARNVKDGGTEFPPATMEGVIKSYQDAHQPAPQPAEPTADPGTDAGNIKIPGGSGTEGMPAVDSPIAQPADAPITPVTPDQTPAAEPAAPDQTPPAEPEAPAVTAAHEKRSRKGIYAIIAATGLVIATIVGSQHYDCAGLSKPESPDSNNNTTSPAASATVAETATATPTTAPKVTAAANATPAPVVPPADITASAPELPTAPKQKHVAVKNIPPEFTTDCDNEGIPSNCDLPVECTQVPSYFGDPVVINCNDGTTGATYSTKVAAQNFPGGKKVPVKFFIVEK